MDSQFGNRLKELRMRRGQTQSEIGVKLGVAKSTISLWERNRVHPHFSEVIKAADFFGVSQAYMLGASETAPENNCQIVELAKVISSLSPSTQEAACDYLRYLMENEMDTKRS